MSSNSYRTFKEIYYDILSDEKIQSNYIISSCERIQLEPDDWIDELDLNGDVVDQIICQINSRSDKRLHPWESEKIRYNKSIMEKIETAPAERIVDLYKTMNTLPFGYVSNLIFKRLATTHMGYAEDIIANIYEYDIERLTIKDLFKMSRNDDIVTEVIDIISSDPNNVLQKKIISLYAENKIAARDISVIRLFKYFLNPDFVYQDFGKTVTDISRHDVSRASGVLLRDTDGYSSKIFDKLFKMINMTHPKSIRNKNIVKLIFDVLGDASSDDDINISLVKDFLKFSLVTFPGISYDFICDTWNTKTAEELCFEILRSSSDAEILDIFSHWNSYMSRLFYILVEFKAVSYNVYKKIKDEYGTKKELDFVAINLPDVKAADVEAFIQKQCADLLEDFVNNKLNLNIKMSDIDFKLSIPDKDTVDLLLELERYKK